MYCKAEGMCDAGVVVWCSDGKAAEEDGTAVGLEEGEEVSVSRERGDARYGFFKRGFLV